MSNAEEKFNTARDRLSTAINDLEKTTLEKIKQIRGGEVNLEGGSSENTKNTINSLSEEINYLQKSLAEVGVENEALSKKSDKLIKEISDLKTGGKKLVGDIRFDLEKVKLLIK